jgi:hypothetical protein
MSGVAGGVTLGEFAGLWCGFSVRDAYFNLPQHRHDLLWFVRALPISKTFGLPWYRTGSEGSTSHPSTEATFGP